MGIIGRKLGMTRIFDEDGKVFPVTVLEAGPCFVLDKKTVEKNGYEGVLLGYMDRKKGINKPMAGFYSKIGMVPKRYLKEFRGDWGYDIGDEVRVDLFQKGDFVDVRGLSKGRGFQGSIKRHGFHRGPMSHGSHYHRLSGSMGGCADPSRVFKGKKLPGRMGGVGCVVQNLKVIDIQLDSNLILLLGSIPGANGGVVNIMRSIKKKSFN